MTDKSFKAAVISAGLLIALGLGAAGYFISTTMYKGKAASNTVTVKGFAEQDVKADLALWQIGYSITGGSLPDAYARSNTDAAKIIELLTKKGFTKDEILPGQLDITDRLANQYSGKAIPEDRRYILSNVITVRSNRVDLVEATTGAMEDLIKDGIALTSNSVDYQFTKLNDIKASMLRTATQNARGAAQQFANDAESRVGSIQNATQGFFSIDSRDSAAALNPDQDPSFEQQQQSTIDKRVRVVVTLTYYLVK